MNRLLTIFIVLCLAFLVSGCSPAPDRSSGEETVTAEDSSETVETGTDLPDGFPGTVPLHGQANIVTCTKSVEDGMESFFVNMEFSGEIGQLSEWYKRELEDNWQVDSISEGDFEDWSEFYADAQNNEYLLSVYLYQDEGSGSVSIDIYVNVKGETTSVGEATEEIDDQEQQEEASTEAAVAYSGELEDAEIVFICASVGSAWNINEHFPSLNITVYDEYQFNKGDIIRDVLNTDKPDIMIIKECAAYFPPEEMGSSMEAYRDLVRDWVSLCRGEGVIPVLTTVVPIDPDNPNNWDGQLESILEYNDWIREYCTSEGISVLDLEAAVRVSEGNRVLDPRYDSGDGLHLNDLAYTEKLDHILIPALEAALEMEN
jgi:hypothetical protein